MNPIASPNVSAEFWKDRKVFLTGHTGFKGSWLSIWLRDMGARVSGYALEPNTMPCLFDDAGIAGLVVNTIGDVRDFAALRRAMSDSGAEIVLHFAAQPLVQESFKDPLATFSTNAIGTANLLEAVRQCPSVRVVLNVTTDKVYLNNEWDWGYRENEKLGGSDPYSASKACSELITWSFRDSFFAREKYGKTHQVAIATARAGNVIGGGDWAASRLVPDCIRAFLSNRRVRIRNPHSTRPWQHVLEPLSAYLLICERLFRTGPECSEPWNIGPNSEDSRTVEWIASTMCSLWKDSTGIEIEESAESREVQYLKLDSSKIRNRLGWMPRWSIHEALDRVVQWNQQVQAGRHALEVTRMQIREYASQR